MAGTRCFARVLAVTLLALQLVVQVAAMVPRWDIDRGLPVQLSDLAGLTTAYALWSGRRWAFCLAYYWGLTLAPQALVTPVLLAPDSPDWAWWLDWVWHLLVVAATGYLLGVLRMRPDWAGYRLAVGVTAGWAVAMLTLNWSAGTNYGYLNGKPGRSTLLDLFGPWPAYLVPEAALVLAVWGLLTWPWVRAASRGRRRVPG